MATQKNSTQRTFSVKPSTTLCQLSQRYLMSQALDTAAHSEDVCAQRTELSILVADLQRKEISSLVSRIEKAVGQKLSRAQRENFEIAIANFGAIASTAVLAIATAGAQA